MEQTNWWKIAFMALVALALFFGGFFIGRQREVNAEPQIEYIELPPIHDSIPKPVPYKVVEPADTLNIIMTCIKEGLYSELFPEKKDTIYITADDTVKVLKDWATERYYSEVLFDSDTLGRFSYDATVKYNRMTSFEYTFKPMQRQVTETVTVTRKYLPYIGAGLSTDGSLMAQGGMFFRQDAGFGLQYQYNTKLNQHSVGAMFLYMF